MGHDLLNDEFFIEMFDEACGWGEPSGMRKVPRKVKHGCEIIELELEMFHQHV